MLELADNFCFYNKNYDSFAGFANWAQQTLNDHKKDKRPVLYTQEELEYFKTHDHLWNACQLEVSLVVPKWEFSLKFHADGAQGQDARIHAHVLGQEDIGVDRVTRRGTAHSDLFER